MRQSLDLVGTGWSFPFGVDGRGSVALASGADDIEQAIEIILSTPVGQRMMRPLFGCRIHELLFAPINTSTITAAVHYVRDALAYWEPRIEVLDVVAEPDTYRPSCMLMYISYRIKTSHDERALVYPFYSIPEEQ